MNICICITRSVCCTLEANINQLYSSKIKKYKIKLTKSTALINIILIEKVFDIHMIKKQNKLETKSSREPP